MIVGYTPQNNSVFWCPIPACSLSGHKIIHPSAGPAEKGHVPLQMETNSTPPSASQVTERGSKLYGRGCISTYQPGLLYQKSQ